MNYLFLLSALLMACKLQAAPDLADKGAVYGVLTADAHTAVKEKRQQLSANSNSNDPYSTDKETGLVLQENMVNYAALDDLYVGLIVPTLSPQQHIVHVSSQGASPRAVALAVGDILQVYNDTTSSQAFFISQTADSGDGLQGFPSLAAGSSASYTVKLAGSLELLSENDATLKVSLFSKQNMLAKRVSSGDTYEFENLDPGEYSLIFWHWRLGKMEQRLQIKAGERINVDKTLSVDNLMRAQ